jgi:hypothetical protein
VINDTAGLKNVVLIGDAAGRTVWTYERGDREFTAGLDGGSLSWPGGMWKVSEDALIGPGGERLGWVAGHIACWFAWDGYLGNRSELYQITRWGVEAPQGRVTACRHLRK